MQKELSSTDKTGKELRDRQMHEKGSIDDEMDRLRSQLRDAKAEASDIRVKQRLSLHVIPFQHDFF